MKIQFCSDLHLEFPSNRKWMEEHPIEPLGDILILAGDIYYLDRSFQKLDFLRLVSKQFEAVYLVPGNHEYYGGFNVASALEPTHRNLFDNIYLVNNYKLEYAGVSFLFSTMWSKIEKYKNEVLKGMYDFRSIKFDKQQFTVAHYNCLHVKAMEFLRSSLKECGRKVVVTHHLPSLLCNSSEFQASPLNEAFCVDQSQLIIDNEIDYWIYGHSHRNLQDFRLGNTNLVTNQLGYVDFNEHQTFNYGKVIEL